jgi:hypothetical protein
LSRFFPGGLDYFLSSVAALLAVVAMGSLAVLYVINLLHKDSPSAVVPRLAGLYLNALAVNDYGTAYPMLSEASRLHCTSLEYSLRGDPVPWSWSNMSLALLEPQLAIVEYDRLSANRPTIRQTLLLVKEGGKWVIPYDEPALSRARHALQLGRNELALVEAQQAAAVDPYDADALTTICAAERRLKLGQADDDCRSAQETAKRYPRAPR